jgi:hypothetical protein
MGLRIWESDGSIEYAALAGDAGFLRSALSSYRGFLFFTGGGNIGIYADNEKIRKRVIDCAEQSRGILVFPQSCLRPENALSHPRVTVWAREAASQGLLRSAGIDTELVPDAAFLLDADLPKAPGGEGVFFIRRGKGLCRERIEQRVRIDAPEVDLTYDRPIDDIVSTLRPRAKVVSDRLHGGIIAIAMGKSTAWLPVRYHKVKSFFETWFRDVPGIRYVESQADLEAFLSDPATPSIDLRESFLSRAVPAFHRFLRKSGSGSHPLPVPGHAPLSPMHWPTSAPRLIAITSIRNEIDIVETFVRHTLGLVDGVLAIDDGSTDGTLDVLRALAARGLPIDVAEESSIGYWQRERMTRLMREAALRHGADWVIPLDADEFLAWSDADRLALHAAGNAPFSLPWRTYVPTQADDRAERNPLVRMRHRLAREAAAWHKVLIPRSLALDPGAALDQGSHNLLLHGNPCPAQPLGSAFLGHLPVRSAGQITAKISIGFLQYLVMPEARPGQGSHYVRPYDSLKRDPEAFAARFEEEARRFAAPEDAPVDDRVILDPVIYRGGPLDLTPCTDDRVRAFSALLGYAEEVCRRHRDTLIQRPTLPRESLRPRARAEGLIQPVGHIDFPLAPQSFPIATLPIQGWALIPGSVIDVVAGIGDAWTALPYPVDRPDVGAAYPSVPEACRSGFAGSLAIAPPQKDPAVLAVVFRYIDAAGRLRSFGLERMLQADAGKRD